MPDQLNGNESQPELRILSFVNHIPPIADIEESIERAMGWGVDVIVAQGTGSDWGPYWLGSGLQPEANVARNVRPYVRAAIKHNVPFVFSFGIAGGNVHLDHCLKAFDEVCIEEGWNLQVGVIESELDPEYVAERVREGGPIIPAGDGAHLSPHLTEADARAAKRIVALIGPEPVQAALAAGVDGVITGRALDVGIFMALPMSRGLPIEIAAHAGKLLECGGLALEPGDSANCMWAKLTVDGLELRSPTLRTKATVRSLVSHGFYERAHPYEEDNPGGRLDLSEVVYEPFDGGVRAKGAKWIPAPYTVLMEGATSVGFRAICVLGVRDPRLLEQIRTWSDLAEEQTRERFGAELFDDKRIQMSTRIFGLDAVLGPLEREQTVTGHEASVIVDVVAETQELANEVAYYAFIRLFIGPYPGRKTTAGNAAAPFMPVVIPVGEVFTFGVYHLLPLEDPCAPFPFGVRSFGTHVESVPKEDLSYAAR
jgi:hypothetical protein